MIQFRMSAPKMVQNDYIAPFGQREIPGVGLIPLFKRKISTTVAEYDQQFGDVESSDFQSAAEAAMPSSPPLETVERAGASQSTAHTAMPPPVEENGGKETV